jgi:hypothetical protein
VDQTEPVVQVAATAWGAQVTTAGPGSATVGCAYTTASGSVVTITVPVTAQDMTRVVRLTEWPAVDPARVVAVTGPQATVAGPV